MLNWIKKTGLLVAVVLSFVSHANAESVKLAVTDLVGLEELQRETKKLEAIGEAQHELPVTDVRRIYTRDFYEWFIRDKKKDLADAKLRVLTEEQRVAENKEEATALVQVLGFIAIVFVAFLAFLIYMRIDLGLRLICKTIADNPGNPLTGNLQATSENADGDSQ